MGIPKLSSIGTSASESRTTATQSLSVIGRPRTRVTVVGSITALMSATDIPATSGSQMVKGAIHLNLVKRSNNLSSHSDHLSVQLKTICLWDRLTTTWLSVRLKMRWTLMSNKPTPSSTAMMKQSAKLWTAYALTANV